LCQNPQYYINATWLRRHPAYSLVYIVIGNLFVMYIFPVIALTVLNKNICSIASRLTVLDNRASSRNQRDSTMVALLFSIVLLFICCHFCKLILNLYEAFQMIWFGTIEQWPKWADNLAQWNHLLLVVNSSGNILIYIVKDFKFRRALCLLMTCRERETQSDSQGFRRGSMTSLTTCRKETTLSVISNSSISD